MAQVWGSPAPARLAAAARAAAASARARLCLTLVPAAALHNAFTFLSISGLRLQE